MTDRTRTSPRLLDRALTTSLAGAGLIGALAGCATATTTGSTSGGAAEARSDSGGASFTDGTFTGSGDYATPGGQESIDVRVTLKGDRVTAITVTPNASGGNALQYQTAFAGGISDRVVGKRIDQLSDVSRVSGSSLTSGGFRKAIAEIESLAKE